jgi:hypothetical protein
MITCPICGAEAERLPKTGDSEGFDCPRHGKFKVADTVFAIETNGRWEGALAKAKARAEVDELPLIMTYDF